MWQSTSDIVRSLRSDLRSFKTRRDAIGLKRCATPIDRLPDTSIRIKSDRVHRESASAVPAFYHLTVPVTSQADFFRLDAADLATEPHRPEDACSVARPCHFERVKLVPAISTESRKALSPSTESHAASQLTKPVVTSQVVEFPISSTRVAPNPQWADYEVAAISLQPLPVKKVYAHPAVSVQHVSFKQVRERVGISTGQARTESRSPLPRVTPLDIPPELEQASLVERLRWLLTPPIHQLVRDLCVPDKPFKFQLQGINWLKPRQHALLADEMGLGKTMQAILAARLLWRERAIENILVICPRSLMANWKREFAHWWPDSQLYLREPDSDRRWFLRLATPNVLIKLVNYEAIARDADWLKANPISHDLVIIDEAQRIKNGSSKAAQAVRMLRGRRCWALTGTPLENSVDDLLSIMEFVHPEAASKATTFESLRKLVRTCMLRRRLEDPDVGLELPPMLNEEVAIELTQAQRGEYDRIESEGIRALNNRGDTVTVHHVFALIRALTQVCNFDAVTGESAKCDRLLEDFDEVSSSGKKAIIFSQFVSEEFGLRRVAKRFREKSFSVLELHGQVPAGQRDGIIHRFAKSPHEQALLLNYRVGGVGLNLQAAGYVFLFDRWWNPAVEDQAIKRAHRIGQQNRVIVRRFFCKDTIEERILQALGRKRRLFQAVIDESRPVEATGLSEEELFSLFDLKVRPRRAEPSGPPRVRLALLDSRGFEELVAMLFEKQGYTALLTGGRGDGGIDVLAEKRDGPVFERIAVQCKHVTAPVGPEDLRALFGAVANDQSITSGVLVTSSTFSRDSRRFADGKRLGLIDRSELKAKLKMLGVAEIQD